MHQGRTTFHTAWHLLRRVWALTTPFFRSEQRLTAIGLLAAIIAMTLGGVYLSVQLNTWYREFYDAMEQRDFDAFKTLLLYFCGLVSVNMIVAVYRVYLTQMLEMRWRTWLTHRYVGDWLSKRIYYRLELENTGTDNPDQRIAEDLRSFTTTTLSLSLGLLSAVVTLGSFLVILWDVGGPLTFTLAGSEVTIPGFMVWMALIYATVGTILTHFVGRKLIGINFRQERFEADFRFSLVRLRENAEGVALYRGEQTEEAHLRQRFGAIQANWWELMRYTKRLTFFTFGYNQAAVIFPFIVSAPRLFAGEIALGSLIQISQAFGQVQDSLSWFVNAYGSLAGWKASVDRLITFHDALERIGSEAEAAQAGGRGIHIVSVPEPTLHAEGLTLALPDGREIVSDATFTVERGERVLVSGPTGAGKSTLLRAAAGIWPYGEGRIELPEGASVLFLPQKPYMPIGTLRAAVCYPAPSETFSDEAVRETLRLVTLGGLAERLDETRNWSMTLSGGELQRLAVARALLHRPDWLFLDEATSALDAATEQRVYDLLRERLGDATIVSVAHRPPADDFQDAIVELTPGVAGATLHTHRAAASRHALVADGREALLAS